MIKFKKGDRVEYVGNQPSLKGLKGVVDRDTIAANGNILVQFDGRPKPTVANPKNLQRSGGTVITAGKITTGKITANKPAANPKDAAVLTYGTARDARSKADRDYKAACKGLSDLGLIDLAHEHQPGNETVYESNAVRLVAETKAAGTMFTAESISEAALQAGVTPGTLRMILDLAKRNKKAATSYKVVVK